MIPNRKIKDLSVGEICLSPTCQIVTIRTGDSAWNVRVLVPGLRFNRHARTLEDAKRLFWLAAGYIRTTTPFKKVRHPDRNARKIRKDEKRHQEWLARLCTSCKGALPQGMPFLHLGLCKWCYHEVAFCEPPIPEARKLNYIRCLPISRKKSEVSLRSAV